jgi:DNA-binding beta-propeller fold protein YncE
MQRSRPQGPAAFTGNRRAPVLALIGALLVIASTASVASAATFIKDWHVPYPQGIAVGRDHVYVAGGALRAYTTDGDFRWERHPSHACSVAFRHSDGHLFVGTCASAPDGHGGDAVEQYDGGGRPDGSLVGWPYNHAWAQIQAVAVHANVVYFSEQTHHSVMLTAWPYGPWGYLGVFDTSPGLALTANRLYGIQSTQDYVRLDRVYICHTAHGEPQYSTRCDGASYFGGPGSADGQFNNPQGIAVGGPHGNVFVADTGNNRIEEFTHNGAFLNAWTGPGPGGGNFNAPKDVGVDASGHVYVADTAHNRIVKFMP